MKYSLKKIIALTATLMLCMPFSFAAADVPVNDELFDYIFYIEFINDKPQASADVKIPYYIIPVTEHAALLSSGEFRGDIMSGKGKLLTSFWFDAPKTTIVATGKSRLDIYAPYFANADHVSFFSKNGVKPLFTISLKSSSFCNDNNKCEKDTGENYFNCSNDCPAPLEVVIPTPITTSPEITEPEAKVTSEEAPKITIDTATTNEKISPLKVEEKASPKNNIIQLTVGVFLALLSVVGFLAWKRMNRKDTE